MNRHLFYTGLGLVFLASINAFAKPSAVPLIPGLVSDWNAMHAQGSQVSDSTGRNNGLLNGVSAYWDGNGEIFSFVNSGNNIAVVDDPSLNSTSAFTVLAWVRANTSSMPGNQVLMSKILRNQSMSAADLASYDATDTICASCGRGYFTKPIFDGRYVYSISNPPTGSASVFFRYDTYGSMNDGSSYNEFATLKLAVPGDIHWYSGYNGGVYDGRYIYLVPNSYIYEPGVNHGLVLRYDTQAPFTETASYNFMDIRPLDGIYDLVRFKDGLFDGRYVYFTGGGVRQNANSKVARYDTTMDFKNTAAWSYVAINNLIPSVGATSYQGMLQVGTYIYFTPSNGQFVRYDSMRAFNDPLAWVMYDASNTGGTGTSMNYMGGTFDGRYIYFSPYTGFSESILRYDTSLAFDSPAAWSSFSVKESTSGTTWRQKSYNSAGFDGRYVYFFPYMYKETILPRTATYYGGRLLRYDTTLSFNSSDAWTQQIDMGNKVSTFSGGVFDQRYFYLMSQNLDAHARIFRLDTANANNYAFSLNNMNFINNGTAGGLFGPGFSMTTTAGYYSLFSKNIPGPGWHLLAGSYDGSRMSIYLDGKLVASRDAAGTPISSPASLLIGSSVGGSFFYTGDLNKAEFYNRALSQDDILAVYKLSPYGGCGDRVKK